MREHASRYHQSLISVCFAQATLATAIDAAAAVERSGQTPATDDEAESMKQGIQRYLDLAKPGRLHSVDDLLADDFTLLVADPTHPPLFRLDGLATLVPGIVHQMTTAATTLRTQGDSFDWLAPAVRSRVLVATDLATQGDLAHRPFGAPALLQYGALSPRLHSLMASAASLVPDAWARLQERSVFDMAGQRWIGAAVDQWRSVGEAFAAAELALSVEEFAPTTSGIDL
jgi:hypothetical protein